ncbi:helix-turn-helix transcriptional regulator [Brevibacillus ginsengisoli]|uniref:helix-turn-helix transcriptional regulator n=1 Tax=Brevibacillus ginsengisoli TaxID=363854 RepID=UPI003CE97B70
MNKTDRLLAIVLELQRQGKLRAEDLAARFETSVRTIYRDIQALSEAGVPVVGAPGVGYSLMDGYFLPPVSFTVEEAVTLLIGSDFVEQKFDRSYGSQAQAARGKIEAILPENVRKETSRVRTTIKLLIANGGHNGQEKELIETLRHAILDGYKVSFHYVKSSPEADGNRLSSRSVAPYGLVHVNGAWTLIAHCELRQDIRHFRLSRMSELTILEDRFAPPSDFNLQDYRPLDDRTTLVRLRVEPSIADKVKESNFFFLEETEEHPDGLLVTLRVRKPEEVLQWVLGWGAGLTVLEPESLRQLVQREAQKMLNIYQSE